MSQAYRYLSFTVMRGVAGAWETGKETPADVCPLTDSRPKYDLTSLPVLHSGYLTDSGLKCDPREPLSVRTRSASGGQLPIVLEGSCGLKNVPKSGALLGNHHASPCSVLLR